MCKQPNGSVSNRNPQGGKSNVTQQQNKAKGKRSSKLGNGKAAKSDQGNFRATTADPCPNKGNTRTDRSRQSAPQQPGASNPGGASEANNTRHGVHVSGTSRRGSQRTGNSAHGTSGLSNEDRPIHDSAGIWEKSKISPDFRARQREKLVSQEDLLIETWHSLFTDLCPSLAPAFHDSIVDYGLVGTIIRFQRIAGQMINDQTPVVLDQEFVRILKQIPLRDALQLLRFGKRYTPVEWTEDMSKSVMSKFHSRNNRAKLLERRELPYWLAKRLKRIGTKICNCALKGRNFSDLLRERSFEVDYAHLPNGTTADGLRSPFEKWLYLAALWGEIEPTFAEAVEHKELGSREDVYSKLVLVPKDYRGPRVIMEEQLETVLQQSIVADAIMTIITNATPTTVPFLAANAIRLDDQTQNQEMARLGALHGYFSTLDLKDASDSITRRLIWAIFPDDIAKAILECVTERVLLPDGKIYALHMPCTMGSRLTVPVQSFIYWVIVCAAAEIAYELGIIPSLDILRDCSVYNDDIIVPYVLYDIVSALLLFTGLIVNHDKSYDDGHPFRESCGVDYYLDNEVTTIYWPRRELNVALDELPSLSALHNRLYSIGAMHAASVVKKRVLALQPKMPCVTPEDVEIGLYAEFSNRRVAPYVCDMYKSVAYQVDVVERFVKKTLIVKLEARDKFSPCYQGTTVRSLERFLTDPFIDTIDIMVKGKDLNWFLLESLDAEEIRKHDPICTRALDIRLRRQEIPGAYTVRYPRVVETYNNRKINGLVYDREVITQKQLSRLVEVFDYNRWLMQGSEYYDPLCEWLHVTQPSRIGNRMIHDGYKIGTLTATIFNPAEI
jgi:hypothetical protein